MSRLADLIEELCPDGVEYTPLGEVGEFVRGSGLQKSDFVDEGLPCVHYGQIHTRFGIAADEAVGKATVWLGHEEVAIGGDMFIFCHVLESKYVSYFFASSLFGDQKRPYITATKVKRISEKGLSRIRIPVPPLAVQCEIVRILDQFTTLEAELEARRAQYEYYRNQLLSYDALASRGPVEWVKLKDIVSMRAGSSITSKDIATVMDSSHVYPCYGANGIRGYVSAVTNRDNASIIGRQGALSGNISFAEAPFFATEHAVVVTPKVKLISRWLYHTFIVAELSTYVTKSAQPGLSVRRLEQVEVLFPSIEEQQRIADILDRFDALVNDISSGLPAEIAARRAQYEYYRDRLLSFPEKK